MFFISPQNLFSLSTYLSFYFDVFVMYQNSLIEKVRLISKFMTSQPGKQTIVILILSNISRSKDNQTIKLDQLIESNIRNIFIQKSFP